MIILLLLKVQIKGTHPVYSLNNKTRGFQHDQATIYPITMLNSDGDGDGDELSPRYDDDDDDCAL